MQKRGESKIIYFETRKSFFPFFLFCSQTAARKHTRVSFNQSPQKHISLSKLTQQRAGWAVVAMILPTLAVVLILHHRLLLLWGR